MADLAKGDVADKFLEVFDWFVAEIKEIARGF